MTNFGIKLFLDTFLDYARHPFGRAVAGAAGGGDGEDDGGGGIICPEHEHFSGFVFKLQANLDPKHRDRMAFIR